MCAMVVLVVLPVVVKLLLAVILVPCVRSGFSLNLRCTNDLFCHIVFVPLWWMLLLSGCVTGVAAC